MRREKWERAEGAFLKVTGGMEGVQEDALVAVEDSGAKIDGAGDLGF